MVNNALGALIMEDVRRYNDGNGCTRRQLVDAILITVSQCDTITPANTAEVERLRAALEAYVKFSDEAAKMLDADQDHTALKLLLAMAGHARRYRHDVDAARAALETQEVEGG